MGNYLPSQEEITAMHWCINNKIKIYPVAQRGNKKWYICVERGSAPVASDPSLWGKGEIWEKIYEYYVYYYNKRHK